MLGWLEEVGVHEFSFQCVIFYFELVIGVLLFACHFKRKKYFAARILGSVAIVASLSVLIVWAAFRLYYNIDSEQGNELALLGLIAISYLFCTLFVCMIMVRFCFKAGGWEAVFCGVCGYSVQHIIYRINLLFQYYFFFRKVERIYSTLFLLASAIIVYVVVWYFFSRRLNGREKIEVENKKLVALFAVVLVVMMIFSALGLTYIGATQLLDTSMMFVECGFAIIVCGLTLFAVFDSIKSKEMEAKNKRLYWLWRADRKQFEISKQNVEQLNVKYHDLKYMLRTIDANKNVEEEIENCLRLYEAHFNTGNETLDVVLTEKSIRGAKYHINIACMADGSCLEGMDPVHLYSLFGNALDNAIDCLKKVDDDDKKIITVNVCRNKDMVIAEIENYTPIEPQLKNGLPLTTKQDAENHGFGMISMRNITERYGGIMNIVVKNNMFSLAFLFPSGVKSLKNDKKDSDIL